jgi:hypothetical protein
VTAVNIELQVIPDCPHTAAAHALLRQALDDLGLTQAPIATTVITDVAHAERAGFHGSPAFVVNGHDIFTAPPHATPALTCRLYRTTTGAAPLPDLTQLRQQLKQAAADA